MCLCLNALVNICIFRCIVEVSRHVFTWGQTPQTEFHKEGDSTPPTRTTFKSDNNSTRDPSQQQVNIPLDRQLNHYKVICYVILVKCSFYAESRGPVTLVVS